MHVSTLGGLIKDYRLQKGISQLEIAFSMGWKEPSRLSRIEQGKVDKPPRELIDLLMIAMDLREEEKNALLLAGNYLPTEDEIAKVREETRSQLENWPYPATVLDFSWRAINQNERNIDVYQVPEKVAELIYSKHLRVLDLLLMPNLAPNRVLKGDDLKSWHTFLTGVIMQFRYEQRNRTKEKWYIDHVKELMNNELFRRLWMEAQKVKDFQGIVGKFAKKRLAQPEDPSKTLSFYLFVVPVLKDPRFEMELLVPSDLETYGYYHH